MRCIRLMLSTVLAVAVYGSYIRAGILMVSSQDSYVEPVGEVTIKSHVDEDRIRVETKGKGINQILIFREDKGVFWMIDNEKQTVMEITKKDLEKTKRMMEETMKTVEEDMKSMPPSVREMMKKMTKEKPESKLLTMVYEKKSSGEKVNRWVCDKYEGRLGDEKKQEVWTTDWKKLGLASTDFKVMQDIGGFFEEFSKEFAASYKLGSEEWEKDQGYSGIPVKTVLYSGGRICHKIEVKEITRQDFNSSLFELPEGLEKKEGLFEHE